MVGREVKDLYPRTTARDRRAVARSAVGLRGPRKPQRVSFTLRAGEILRHRRTGRRGTHGYCCARSSGSIESTAGRSRDCRCAQRRPATPRTRWPQGVGFLERESQRGRADAHRSQSRTTHAHHALLAVSRFGFIRETPATRGGARLDPRDASEVPRIPPADRRAFRRQPAESRVRPVCSIITTRGFFCSMSRRAASTSAARRRSTS